MPKLLHVQCRGTGQVPGMRDPQPKAKAPSHYGSDPADCSWAVCRGVWSGPIQTGRRSAGRTRHGHLRGAVWRRPVLDGRSAGCARCGHLRGAVWRRPLCCSCQGTRAHSWRRPLSRCRLVCRDCCDSGTLLCRGPVQGCSSRGFGGRSVGRCILRDRIRRRSLQVLQGRRRCSDRRSRPARWGSGNQDGDCSRPGASTDPVFWRCLRVGEWRVLAARTPRDA